MEHRPTLRRRGRTIRTAALCLVAVLGVGCRGAQRKAVEQALQDHLQENTHLAAGSYSTKIEQVTFNGNNAEALVRFDSKRSSNLFVEIRYELRVENGRWQVVSSTPVSGSKGDSHQPRDGDPASPHGAQPGFAQQPGH